VKVVASGRDSFGNTAIDAVTLSFRPPPPPCGGKACEME
jgi:hypothetical protein